MWDKLWVRIIVCLISVIALLYVGFMGLLITALAGGIKFYTPLVGAITVVLILYVVFRIFRFLRSKYANRLLMGFVGICLLSAGGHEISRAYYRSIPGVNDQGVNLLQYQPFANGTKAVKLNETSSLKLTENLPRIDGATALYPLYSSFAQAVYPEKSYDIYNSEVTCSNTIEAYKNLIEGRADIIFAARPSQEQLDYAEDLGIKLKLTPIGKEAFVFFVNSKNPVTELSTAQIQSIYSGDIINWKEVGGKNEKIRAFQRPQNSGSQTMLQKIMEGRKLMSPPTEDVALGMGDIISETASYKNYKNAIGYSFLFFATEMVRNNQIRLLKVDGIYPSKETIRSKAYPLTAEFYAVTAGSKNPNIDKFINWILSSQGQELVEKTGYTSISR